jgi:hypothetical protein
MTGSAFWDYFVALSSALEGRNRKKHGEKPV